MIMHGLTNPKFINAKQACDIYVYAYRNVKRKLHKTIAAIWFNKTCRDKKKLPMMSKRMPETC
jgi:hypothetical protein